MVNDYIRFERIKILVFVRDMQDARMYCNLFDFLLGDRVISRTVGSRGRDNTIHGSDFTIEFRLLSEGVRGYRSHFVINMVQDIELDQCVAQPTTSIQNHLRRDPRWETLFR